MKTWIVTPVYRDTESFLILRERVLESLAAADREADPHFVVIDDTAGADPEMEGLRGIADVTVLTPPFNLGHQRGLVYALRKLLPSIADEDVVVTMDADGEDRPEDLPRLLDALEEGGGRQVVLALRTKRHEPLAFKLLYPGLKLISRAL